MKMGVIGLPQSGKKTLFSLIIGKSGSMSQKGERKIAVSQIRDKRLDKLHTYYPTARKMPATVEFLLIPDVTKDEKDRTKAFSQLAESNAVLLVVRAFPGEAVYHPEGSIDAARDIRTLYDEMVLYDLDLVERRLVNLEKDIKRKKTDLLEKENVLLLSFKKNLEEGKPLRNLTIDEESSKMIRGFNFLTLKPVVILLNVEEKELKGSSILKKVQSDFGSETTGILQFCAPIEMEIGELDESEKQSFLEDLGVEEPAIDRIIKASYATLGYISFFTVGDDEVRAWTLKKGSAAPTAAGVIHSDLEKGFIRAEVTRYEDFVALGSEAECRKKGKQFLKGKDYIVEDGDILCIRFNV
jgi:ribosome-binding ATPase